tara:strand:- start:81 stop:1595 length:1515 start_codon:yes stop_codon:yes gene_type:complete
MSNSKERKNFYFKKLIQQGGSTKALQMICANRDVLNIFITDNSDLQVNQVVTRLLESGVSRKDMVVKKEIKHLNRIDSSNNDKIIIINKHPTYSDRLSLLITLANKYANGVDLYWDETDYDSPNYEVPDPTSQKDYILTALAEKCRNVYHITATQVGLAISISEYTECIELPEPPKDFLTFEDLKHIPIDKEYLNEFLKGNVNNKKVEEFLKKYQEQGILIRTDRIIEGMNNIQKGLISRGFTNVNTLTGESYVDPRTVAGILISYKMALRGITFPQMHHMIISLPKTPTAADCLHLLRILGHNKKLKGGNFILCSDNDWKQLKNAHKAERIARDSLKLYANDYKARHEYLKKQEFPYMNLLPKNKMSNFIPIKNKNSDFIQVGESITYSKKLEDTFNSTGLLAEKLISWTDTTEAKWGARSFERVVNDMINHAPNSKVRLERSLRQKVADGYGIERLKDKKELQNMKICIGLTFDVNTREFSFITWQNNSDISLDPTMRLTQK